MWLVAMATQHAYLGTGFTGSFCFGSHGPLQLLGKTNILTIGNEKGGNKAFNKLSGRYIGSVFQTLIVHSHFHAFHLYSPRVSSFVKNLLQGKKTKRSSHKNR